MRVSSDELKGYFYSAVSGLVLWLAMPGEGKMWGMLFIGIVPLLTAVYSAKSIWVAVKYGLVFGFVHYLCLLYWIVIVLGKYGGFPLYLSLPALALLALIIGSYSAIFTAFSRLAFSRLPTWLWFLLLPVAWVAMDWLRSWLFSGFPWMDLGYGLWEVPFLIQVADLAGHFGLTFFIVLCNVALFQQRNTWCSRGAKLFSISVLLLALVSVLLYGNMRLSQMSKDMAVADSAMVGVVQGNIDQSEKWSPEKRMATVQNYLQLSRSLVNEKPDLIVWPETALPFYLTSKELLAPISSFLQDEGQTLLTGAPWYELPAPGLNEISYYNSAITLDQQSRLTGKYYKSHLVPFGEYVPLEKFLPFLAPLVVTVGDFSPGKIEKPLVSGDLRVGILICYESIFPDISRKWSETGANILVNLTNDAWYGKSSAPYQSLAMVVLRAVETRRSVVRSANTGISGFVDPRGIVVSQSELFVPWAQNSKVLLNNEQTIFVRGGWKFAPACFCLAVICLLLMVQMGNKYAICGEREQGDGSAE